jgi:hypothetical protein
VDRFIRIIGNITRFPNVLYGNKSEKTKRPRALTVNKPSLKEVVTNKGGNLAGSFGGWQRCASLTGPLDMLARRAFPAAKSPAPSCYLYLLPPPKWSARSWLSTIARCHYLPHGFCVTGSMVLTKWGRRMKFNTYGYEALGGWNEQAEHSASAVIPLALALANPKSVVDVGCGPGIWLESYRKHGISDFLGIDGPWVRPETLRIPKENFRVEDLSKPLAIGRQFDLVNSLEVAEHLDAGCADVFARSLASLGDLIVFSAAIPGQRGYHHVNEQFQGYWVEKFQALGFECYD